MAKKKGLTDYGVMDNKDVMFGYRYWLAYFTELCYNLIVFEGLPESLPQIEVIRRLINRGFCTIFKHPVEGIVTSNSVLWDYDWYGRLSKFNVTNPHRSLYKGGFVPSGKVLGKDGVALFLLESEQYLNGMDTNLDIEVFDNIFFNTLRRYARMMADIEATLQAEMITQRMPFILVAPNQQAYDSINNMFVDLENGKIRSVMDMDFLSDIKSLKNKELVANYLTELINNRRNIQSMFLAEIGFFTPDVKRERLVAREVENGQNNQMTLMYNMIKSLEKGCEALNKLYGLNVSVELNQTLYDVEVPILGDEEEGQADDNL